MELTQKEIRDDNIPTMSIKEFIDRYHPGLSNQAVDYAMKNNLVDYVRYGRFRNVAMTATTADYVPRSDAKVSRTK